MFSSAAQTVLVSDKPVHVSDKHVHVFDKPPSRSQRTSLCHRQTSSSNVEEHQRLLRGEREDVKSFVGDVNGLVGLS